jgi:hypothetical protein
LKVTAAENEMDELRRKLEDDLKEESLGTFADKVANLRDNFDTSLAMVEQKITDRFKDEMAKQDQEAKKYSSLPGGLNDNCKGISRNHNFKFHESSAGI